MKNSKVWPLMGLIAFMFVFIQSDCLSKTPNEKLKYQNRGNYWEGIKSRPSADDFIELLSVLVDYTENHQSNTCKIGFYLDRDVKTFITVRETDNRHFYWLDKTKPVIRSKGFKVFKWPVSVIKRIPGLDESQLGIVVRVGKNEKGLTETVAPAVFYDTKPPRKAEAYLFTVKPMRNAEITCRIFSEDGQGKKTFVCGEKFETVSGGMPLTFRWDCSKAVEGNHTFQIEGEFDDDETSFAKEVKFYHRPFIGK